MVFDKNFFLTHQKPLLWLANTSYGRDVLGLDSKGSDVGRSRILGIIPNAVFWKEDETYKVEFRTHNKFGKRLYYEYLPLWKTIHAWDEQFANVYFPRLNLGFDTLTAYPDANVESTSVDGRVGKSGVNQNFATIISGNGTFAADSDASTAFFLQASTSSNFQTYVRGIYLFDTSSLTSAATVSAATLSLCGNAASGDIGATKIGNLGTTPFHVCSSSPASNTALATGDYSSLGTTSFGEIAYASWSASSVYNDFTLNASGLAAISNTGITKFGTKLGWDIAGSFTGSYSNSAATGYAIFLADQTGTASDPKLVVTYVLSAGQFFHFM